MKDEQKGIIPFEPWDYLADLLDLKLKNPLLLIGKARQLGISTLIANYALWLSLFFEGKTSYFLSQHEKAAFKLIEKVRLTWEFLPDYLRLGLGKDQYGTLSFPIAHSFIEALPSTETAGRMTGASLVVTDEWEYHPCAEQNYNALMPTISAGGEFIGLTTFDPFKGDSFPKRMFRKAMADEIPFAWVFLDCFKRPGRDEKWYEHEKSKFIGIGFEQENPRSLDEALESFDYAKFFDAEALTRMYIHCSPAIETRYGGIIKIYKPPVPGDKYYGGLDPSDGQYDPCAGVIFHWKTNEQVAELHGKIRTEEVAVYWDKLVREYNDAFNATEVNAMAGGAVVAKQKELETPNIYYHSKDKAGWWTSGNNRSNILLQLADAFYNLEYAIHNKEIIDECKGIVRVAGQDPQAPQGMHDDYVFAMAIANQIKREMPTGGMKIKCYSPIY